ncbi:valine--tRNA ligase [Lachnoanaerobaculum sp. Marseille-Q4761]|uniref:valine--tRNA ligase n=1 Tax=Lachnoanaerobaculum sp. Marseille-Q4761 TaxID=2819511 RepID=UPI001AA1375D|nr:valine--tRNA ligase [Lachnoanaerobaculum sp. Marseille-Q4761]MBO1871763.1 valine--tRNA ligase [Lachnoanaerobaculum sp. Marseille-Q4761]
MKELEKTYSPEKIEGRIYKKWLEEKYFQAKVNKDKKPFTIIMPPPNITGQLHMGHALDNTMQDILIRYKRMAGYEALWQPGTDHAAIATEVKVIEKLKAEGKDKHELGREGFLKEAWDWKNDYGTRIINQLQRLGSSADWDRERFTMDEHGQKAVKEVFVRLYEKGYIYKGNRIINWCPVCKTSISDAEVEHIEMDGNFWHIKYPVAGEEGKFVEIATTRPETLLGDTAVAVNPLDERYKDIIGKKLILPLVGREIPVVADEYVDKEFGTGCVKITPAHDPNDFEVGKRHNLGEINIMHDDATIDMPGSKYDGLDRYEARKLIVKDLEEEGLLVKVVPHSHNVGRHDRCKTVVEPLIKPQWFVSMNEMAKPAIKAIETGELKFVPESYAKTYLHWLENIRDWCISRQLWWGHQIPAYTCSKCGELVVARQKPDCCPKCGCNELVQDEDTLDTWFSSALWPFSTLGWPDNTEEMDYFYPTDVLVTGYDIIFFWVVRMVFSGYEQTGKTPFHTVLIHGLVRDSEGRKMSKSLGNGIDPLEVIDKYGADALRMMLMTGNAPGNDMRFYYEKVESARNFANKIWNAARLIMMNIGESKPEAIDSSKLMLSDKWILSKSNRLVKEVTTNLDKYELGIALAKIYDFAWEEFCDWYIEMVKVRLWNKEDESRDTALSVLTYVLNIILKLLHPFMPFITEEIYCTINEDAKTVMIEPWPVENHEYEFEDDENKAELIKEAVRAVRNVRASMNVPPSHKAKGIVVSEDEKIRDIFESAGDFFKQLAGLDKLIIDSDDGTVEKDSVRVAIPNASICLPLRELVDIKKEVERLQKEEKKLIGEVARSKGMLSNEKFVSKAPQAKIDEEKKKLENYEQMLSQVREQLERLSD